MSLYKHFGTDIEIASVQFPANADNTVPTFQLARMADTNVEYAAAIEKVARDHKMEIDLDMLTEKVAKPIMLKVFVRTVLRGWDAVQTADGQVLPYNEDNAIKLLTDLPDLLTVLRNKAQQLSLFQKREVEGVTKKS